MASEKDDMARTLGLGEHKKRSWKWMVYAGVAAIGVAAWVLLAANRADEDVVYITSPVTRADIEVSVSATGTVEPTDLVEISSELSGTVAAVHVDYNDPVEVGTILAELDTEKLEAQLAVQQASLASADAKVAIAEATLKEAREDYERGLQLEKRGIESAQTLTTQEAAYARARAELQSAVAARDLAQSNVDLVKVDLEKACICSPIKGVVLDRDVDEGQIVAASLSAPILFTLAEDLTRMELQVDVDEADIGRVQVGQSAIFTVEAYDERVFPAKISKLRYASETVDGVVTYKAILTLDNSDMSLRPGMTATADIVVSSLKDALVVPNAALRYAPPQEPAESSGRSGSGLVGMIMPSRPGGNGSAGTQGQAKSVWVLRDEMPVEVMVQTGDTDGNVTAILGGELAEGDQVITDRIDGE